MSGNPPLKSSALVRLHLLLAVLWCDLATPALAEMRLSPEVSVTLTAAPLYTVTALQQAADRFLDLPMGGGGGGGNGPGRALSAFQVVPGPQLGFGVHLGGVLTRNLRFNARAVYLAALTTVRFPNGIDVLTDPATARLFGQRLRGEVAVEWGTGWQVSAGGGVELAVVQARVTSALLDVHSVTRTAQPYILLALGRDLPDGMRLTADLRFNAENADLSVGIQCKF